MARQMVAAVCQQCEKRFQGYRRHKGEDPKYCSRMCYNVARTGKPRQVSKWRPKEGRKCLACGKEFSVGGGGGKMRSQVYCGWACAARVKTSPGAKSHRLSLRDAAYLAGIVDGEGSIMLYKRSDSGNMHVILSVANTNRELLEWIHLTTGVGRVCNHYRASASHRAAMFWRATAEAAATVLEQLQPYLIVKRAQAKLGMETQARIREMKWRVDRSWHDEWRQKMQALNRRGPPLATV